VQYYGGRHIPVLLDVNLGVPTGFLADGRPVFSSANRLNQFNQILQLPHDATRCTMRIRCRDRRFSHGLQLRFIYLGMRYTNDSTGDTGSNVTDSTNLKRDYGLSFERSAAHGSSCRERGSLV